MEKKLIQGKMSGKNAFKEDSKEKKTCRRKSPIAVIKNIKSAKVPIKIALLKITVYHILKKIQGRKANFKKSPKANGDQF